MNGKKRMGAVQWRLLERAGDSKLGLVFVNDYVEMRAARKLVARGILVQAGMLPLFFRKGM